MIRSRTLRRSTCGGGDIVPHQVLGCEEGEWKELLTPPITSGIRERNGYYLLRLRKREMGAASQPLKVGIKKLRKKVRRGRLEKNRGNKDRSPGILPQAREPQTRKTKTGAYLSEKCWADAMDLR